MAHKKDAYYFSHDSSASRDIKMLKLKHKHGWEGIGLFWAIVETLRESTDYQFQSDEASIELLSTILGIDNAKLNLILNTCFEVGLFENNGTFFYSNSLNERMSEMNKRRENGYKNGVLGGRPTETKPKQNPNHNPNHNPNDNLNETQTKPFKRKEKKEKENKEKKKADADLFLALGLSEDETEKVLNLGPHEYMEWIFANKALFNAPVQRTLSSGRKVSEPRLDVPNRFKWGYCKNTGFPDINVMNEEERESSIEKSIKNATTL